MGNTISAATSTNASLDLANGNTKVKKDLEVVGNSTFTGKSTFNGELSVTNGKFNNIDVPTLGKDVTDLKTNVTSLQTSVQNVSAGSFSGKAISGATDVTATGTGTFNAVKTNNIDINGEIQSTTGKKYITTSTTGLNFTNGIASGQPANAAINLKSDGGIELTHGTGKSIDIGKTIDGSVLLQTVPGQINANGSLTVGNVLRSNGSLFVSGDSTLIGSVNANGGIVVPTGKTLTVNGDISCNTVGSSGAITVGSSATPANLKVFGTSTLSGTTTGSLTVGSILSAANLTVTGTTSSFGSISALGGITVGSERVPQNLSVTGTSTFTGATTLTGATTATGAITANGGITSSTLTVNGASTLTGATTTSGDLFAKNVIIGTNKWLIEETVDTTKGTRLCFGKMDPQFSGGKRFYTCMNNDGNLELF